MIDDDQHDTDSPNLRLVTPDERREHYAEYEPGTPVVRDVREEHHMHRDLESPDLAQRVQRLEDSHRTFTRALWLLIPALLGGVVTALIYAADKIAVSAERVGKTEAKMEAQEKRIDGQEAEIGQLRAALLRLSGADRHPPNSDMPSRLNKISSLDREIQGLITGSGSPVSHGRAGSNGMSLHVPALQYLQSPNVAAQNEFELQNAPHPRGWAPASRRSESRGPQVARSMRTAMVIVRMPELYLFQM